MNLKISREQFHLMMAMKSELNNLDNGHINLIMHHHIKYRYQDQFYIISYIQYHVIYTVGPKIRTRGGSQFWRESGFLGNFISEKCKSPDF